MITNCVTTSLNESHYIRPLFWYNMYCFPEIHCSVGLKGLPLGGFAGLKAVCMYQCIRYLWLCILYLGVCIWPTAGGRFCRPQSSLYVPAYLVFVVVYFVYGSVYLPHGRREVLQASKQSVCTRLNLWVYIFLLHTFLGLKEKKWRKFSKKLWKNDSEAKRFYWLWKWQMRELGFLNWHRLLILHHRLVRSIQNFDLSMFHYHFHLSAHQWCKLLWKLWWNFNLFFFAQFPADQLMT